MKRKIILISLMLLSIFTLFGCTKSAVKFPTKINKYIISAEYNNENKTLKCSQKVSYVNDTDSTLKELCFYLHPNAFREDVKNKPVSFLNEQKAYPNGKSYGGIDILSVTSKKNDIAPGVCPGVATQVISVLPRRIMSPSSNSTSGSKVSLNSMPSSFAYDKSSFPLA